MGENVLNSWKEIAQYLGRGVRTVQRWEGELGLPVRRPRNRLRSPVIAIPGELDLWLRQGGDQAGKHVRTSHEALLKNTTLLVTQAQLLQAQTRQLQELLTEAVTLGCKYRPAEVVLPAWPARARVFRSAFPTGRGFPGARSA